MGMKRTFQELLFKTEYSELTDWICRKGRGQNQR